jgi:hypothetical protein
MKTLNHILILCAAMTGTYFGGLSPVYAEKMSTKTQDLVIAKMERVISTLDKKDSSWIPSQQRLADLLSERARLRFINEVEANCDGCKGSKDDRKKAVAIYEDLLTTVAINEHGPILFQLAHLYELSGQSDQAIKLFERIIKEAKAKKISEEIVVRSHAALADLYFKASKFKKSYAEGAITLKSPLAQNRGLIIYNMAWCKLNLDEVNKGISTLEDLLKKPELITRETTEGESKYDLSFHLDILRDLATFYARRPITEREIRAYQSYAPKENRKELLMHFASEADRLGQKQAAYQIYSIYMQDTTLTPEERLEGFVKMAQVNYDRGQTARSTQDFAVAAGEFRKTCKEAAKCEQLQKTMKHYVTELHRSKTVEPDKDLLNAYVTYYQTFPDDLEMADRGAHVAEVLEMYAVAIQFYRGISESKPVNPKLQQQALNNELSAAEKAQNPTLQIAAYQHYLAVFPTGPKAFEVRYQLAYLSYQQKKMSDAASQFHTLAIDKSGPSELRKKSADLSLDAVAQTKAEETLEEWAWEYAVVFPTAHAEYETIARKALMNRVARIANDPKSTPADNARALAQVLKAKITGATPAEKILNYTNQTILAKKAGDDVVYLQSLKILMAQPGLSADKKEDLQAQLVSYYEKKLNFKEAYAAASKMHFAKVSPKERELKLGTLADLAGIRPEGHYKKALQLGLRGQSAMSLRARLVLLSSNPVRELKAQAPELRHNPSLLNETTLLVYARTNDKNGLKSVLAMRELRGYSAPNFIGKQEFYNQLESFRHRIAAHRLNATTDKAMQNSIKARVKLLKEADRMLAESLRYKDVTAQILALNLVASENDRMVRDLVALPVPPKLNAQEKAQYLGILKQQSRPYFVKAKTAEQKNMEIWDHSPALTQVLRDYENGRPELKKLLRRELQLLAEVPHGGKLQSGVSTALNEPALSPSDLASARQSVAQNPDNIRDIEKLKNIETKIGHPLMPAYLEARLSQLQRGKSL